MPPTEKMATDTDQSVVKVVGGMYSEYLPYHVSLMKFSMIYKKEKKNYSLGMRIIRLSVHLIPTCKIFLKTNFTQIIYDFMTLQIPHCSQQREQCYSILTAESEQIA